MINSSPEKGKETNLAPSAIFVKENILDKFYPILRAEGLVVEANQIIVSNGKASDEKTVEFRIKCRSIAQKEIEKVDQEVGLDEETKKKKKNAWNNFSATLVSNVKPKEEKSA